MNPSDDSTRICLVIEGLGPVPSFKNTKKIIRNHRTGKPSIITDPKKKQWMEAATRSLESQLRGWLATVESATPGECPKQSPTALLLPSDDCLTEMLPGPQAVLMVAQGCEGAIITIERIVKITT